LRAQLGNAKNDARALITGVNVFVESPVGSWSLTSDGVARPLDRKFRPAAGMGRGRAWTDRVESRWMRGYAGADLVQLVVAHLFLVVAHLKLPFLARQKEPLQD
jgi:hypothetical protein